MEDKPDGGSSSPPFHGFKDLHNLEQDHRHRQEHQQAMGQVSQDLVFPSGEASEIANPWPSTLLHSLSPHHHFSSSITTTAAAATTAYSSIITNNQIPLLSPSPLPPFPPRLPYGYDGFLLPPEPPLNLAAGHYGGLASTSVSPFGPLHSEFSKMTAQEIMDAKALAASRSHSEAERRRRERINGHLARLRSLLPNTAKTDKASLLAEVIQHVKELKRQTSEIAEGSPVPTEADELVVEEVDDDEGRLVLKASLCCNDRPDLLPELIKALRAMRLRALKAEIVTLGGRVRNVLLITGQDGDDRHTVGSVQEALRTAMERAATAAAASAAGDEPSTSNSGGSKRQRTGSLTSILENRSI